MEPEANLVSFVLRFVSEQPANDLTDAMTMPVSSAWHGVIRHVQTNQERTFTRWADAVAFIAQYVDIDKEIAND